MRSERSRTVFLSTFLLAGALPLAILFVFERAFDLDSQA